MGSKLPFIIKLKGGLGNQLFQYAFGKWIELNFGNLIYYDTRGLLNALVPRSLELKDFKLYSIDRDRFIDNHGRVSHAPLKLLYLFYSKTGRVFVEGKADENSSVFRPGIYQGYWQNLFFALPVLEQVREHFDLTIKDERLELILNSEASVAIHIRGTDYLNHPTLIKLDRGYYDNAIEFLATRLSNPEFYVFTDDLTHAAKIMEGIKCRFVSTGKDTTDFALMQSCKHQVIANSTFSWWAAMLNLNPKKILVSPQAWERHKPGNLISNIFVKF